MTILQKMRSFRPSGDLHSSRTPGEFDRAPKQSSRQRESRATLCESLRSRLVEARKENRAELAAENWSSVHEPGISIRALRLELGPESRPPESIATRAQIQILPQAGGGENQTRAR